MKKLISALLAVLMLVSVGTFSVSTVIAQEDFPSDTLIIVNGKAVTKNMHVEDVKKLFGEPVLVTESVFGGFAYTFYGENYSDYLYLETLANGDIAVFASVGEGFSTRYYDFGDEDDFYIIGEKACLSTIDSDTVYGFLYYNYNAGLPKAEDINAKFAEENHKYMPMLAQHTVHMFNALSVNYGYNTPIYYDEYTMQMCLQLNDNNTEAFYYSYDRGYGGFVDMYGVVNYRDDETYSYLPNPMAFAEEALNREVDADKRAIAYTVFQTRDYYCRSYCCTNPQLFEAHKLKVELTEEEKKTISTMKEMYFESVETFNSAEKVYDTEPQFTSLPLTAGKLNDKIAEGSLGYLNTIRYGAGLPLLKLSDELMAGAQAKATYTVFLSQGDYDVPNPHFPPKVDGISDEYYNLCQNGGAENLFWGDAISSIYKALDDGYGDPIYCGHRYNLLSSAADFGIGTTNDQGAHKFSGYQNVDCDFVCWPSKGVTPTEALYRNAFQWTIRTTNKNYGFDISTWVKVKLLNTGDEWIFDRNNPRLHNSGNTLSFSDNSLSLSKGNVYEVTIMDCIDKNTNERTNYTYRSAIVSLGGAMKPIEGVSISGKDSLRLDEKISLKAKVNPDGAENIFVTWESSNPEIAEIDGFGVVTPKALGEVKIIAKSQDGVHFDEKLIKVEEAKKPIEPTTTPDTSPSDPAEDTLPQPTDPVTNPATNPADDPDETLPEGSSSADLTLPDASESNPTAPSEIPSAPSEDTYLLGDANTDGKVNIKDTTTIQKYLASILELDENAKLCANVNLDLKISIKDATMIQKFVANIPVDYPLGQYIKR